MSFTPAKKITSSQVAIHKDLLKVVLKHQKSEYQKPIADHTKRVFEEVYNQWLNLGRPKCFMDSGCGRGESTHFWASTYPDHFVIGLDRSSDRLSHPNNHFLPENMRLIQADCVDFWRLAVQAQWIFNEHAILYPNPYPKSEHLKRRWHAHPVFNCLLSLSQKLLLRTNWGLYAEEFAAAWKSLSDEPVWLDVFETQSPMTAFERKYLASGHTLWQVVCKNKSLN